MFVLCYSVNGGKIKFSTHRDYCEAFEALGKLYARYIRENTVDITILDKRNL